MIVVAKQEIDFPVFHVKPKLLTFPSSLQINFHSQMSTFHVFFLVCQICLFAVIHWQTSADACHGPSRVKVYFVRDWTAYRTSCVTPIGVVASFFVEKELQSESVWCLHILEPVSHSTVNETLERIFICQRTFVCPHSTCPRNVRVFYRTG